MGQRSNGERCGCKDAKGRHLLGHHVEAWALVHRETGAAFVVAAIDLDDLLLLMSRARPPQTALQRLVQADGREAFDLELVGGAHGIAGTEDMLARLRGERGLGP